MSSLALLVNKKDPSQLSCPNFNNLSHYHNNWLRIHQNRPEPQKLRSGPSQKPKHMSGNLQNITWQVHINAAVVAINNTGNKVLKPHSDIFKNPALFTQEN